MPYGNEIGEIGAESAFTVTIEAYSAVYAFDSTGCAMEVAEEGFE